MVGVPNVIHILIIKVIIFCNFPADVRVYSFTIILSVDYLLKIADFFNVPQEQENVNKPVPVSKSTTAVSSKSKLTLQQEPIKSENPSQMTINLKLEKPDIILVEHMDNIDTNAIIVNVSFDVKITNVSFYFMNLNCL